MQGGPPVATPMTAAQMVTALKNEGVHVVEMAGWRTHNRDHKGAWGEVYGLLIHHTAGVSKTMPQFVYNGTTALPGPLCHALTTKDGKAYLVGNGRANHAGLIAANAMASLKAEDGIHPAPGPDSVDGNRQLYGLEIENKGDGQDPYPPTQYDQSVRWAAAICRHHGWTAESIGAHKEVTQRKIDPSFSMNLFRAKVAERLRHAPSWTPGTTTPKPQPPQEASPTRMDYTQMTRSTDLVIPAGQGRPVFFDIEHADDPNDHGDGGRTILDGGQYTGTVWVWLPATVDVEHIGVKMVHELAGGTTSTHSTGHVQTQDVPSTAAVSVTGHVPADRKLFLEIFNSGPTPITVSRVDIRLLSQAI